MSASEATLYGMDEGLSPASNDATYYPVYMHSAHPLKGCWVNLTGNIVEKLHIPPGWEASHPGIAIPGAAPSNSATAFPLYHYLNHPLPFVQICGIVVDKESKERWWEIVLDDGSGMLVNALFKKVTDPDDVKSRMNRGVVKEPQYAGPGQTITAPVSDSCCVSWINSEALDVKDIELGIVLRVKGRINPWKYGLQILVERFDIFRGTTQEITFWETMNCEFATILQRPWVLTDAQVEELEAEQTKLQERRAKLALQKERKAKREAKAKKLAEQHVKEPQHDVQPPEEPEKSEQLRSSGSSSKHPVKVGLATSYQQPQDDSSPAETATEVETLEINESSQSQNAEKAARPTKLHGEHKTTTTEPGSVMGIFQEEPASRSQHHQIDSSRRLTTLVYIDTSGPEYWKQLDLSIDDTPTHIYRGSEWLGIRDQMIQAQIKASKPKLNYGNDSFVDMASPGAWDELDLESENAAPGREVTSLERMKSHGSVSRSGKHSANRRQLAHRQHMDRG